MPNCYLKTLKWSYSRIKERDIFKQSISLTYRGKDNFSSIIGAISTVFVLIVLFCYSIILLKSMFSRSDVSWNQNTIQVDLREDNSSLVWKEEDPKFKIFWNAPGHYVLDEDIEQGQVITGTFVNRQYDEDYFKTSSSEKSEIINNTISASDCSNSFDTYDDAIYNGSAVKPFCPKLDGLSLHGNLDLAIPTSELKFQFSTCNYALGSNCIDVDIANEVVSQSFIKIHIQNRYVDLNDIENPIKNYYDYGYNIKFENNKWKKIKFKLKRHEVVLEDSFLPTFWDPDPLYFNSLEDFEITEEPFILGSETAGLLDIAITRDTQIEQHRRKVLDFLEVTGILGGLFEIFELGFGMLLGLISSYLFKRQIFKDIQRYEEKFKAMEKCIKLLEGKINNNQKEEENEDLRYVDKEEYSKEDNKEESKEPRQNDDLNDSQVKLREFKFLNEGGELFHPGVKNNPPNPTSDPDNKHKNIFLFKRFPDNFTRQSPNLQTIKSSHKVIPESKSIFQKIKKIDEEIGNFENSLDCLNITYSLKTLQVQVAFLLRQNTDYMAELGSSPALDINFANPPPAPPSPKTHPSPSNPAHPDPPPLRTLAYHSLTPASHPARFQKYLKPSP
ncbi:unnamed protein product [Moneuplotes crassus]|uniref:Uncharacterized protein n=1 Tax=Euplotes crassus TaxID=5936 RepID=A0AAD1Y6Y9_EUPCR|nr:unnamed protein product [Moneuplotes crassus]